MKLKLDLHDIYNKGYDIDRALKDVMQEAARTKASVVEIIPGDDVMAPLSATNCKMPPVT